jgi:hypothetical protein
MAEKMSCAILPDEWRRIGKKGGIVTVFWAK